MIKLWIFMLFNKIKEPRPFGFRDVLLVIGVIGFSLACIFLPPVAKAAEPSEPKMCSCPCPPEPPNRACDRLIPGHYFAVYDDMFRKQNGLTGLSATLSKDVSNFKGVVFVMPWGAIETERDKFDFTRLDAALALVKEDNKVLMLMFMDRTFHLGCTGAWLPAYVSREGNYNNTRGCYAKIWQKETMDHEIRVLTAVANRYKDEPAFIGISVPETSVGALSMQGHPEIRLQLYDQLPRLYAALHEAAPNMIVHQMINWGTQPDVQGLVDKLAQQEGGAVGWPDSVPGNAYSTKWYWYDIGRKSRDKVALMVHAQTPFIGATKADTEKVYEFLVNDVQANVVVWHLWHASDGNYFSNAVIPTVNAHNGFIKNTTCPWPASPPTQPAAELKILIRGHKEHVQ